MAETFYHKLIRKYDGNFEKVYSVIDSWENVPVVYKEKIRLDIQLEELEGLGDSLPYNKYVKRKKEILDKIYETDHVLHLMCSLNGLHLLSALSERSELSKEDFPQRKDKIFGLNDLEKIISTYEKYAIIKVEGDILKITEEGRKFVNHIFESIM